MKPPQFPVPQFLEPHYRQSAAPEEERMKMWVALIFVVLGGIIGFSVGVSVLISYHDCTTGRPPPPPDPEVEHREWCAETCEGLGAEQMRHLHGAKNHEGLVCRCSTDARRILFVPREGSGWYVDPRAFRFSTSRGGKQ